MKVTFELEFCVGACRHAYTTSVFDEGGRCYCCNHPELIKPKTLDEYSRFLPSSIEIPDWCPLRTGGKYQ